jgi:DNA-directed RNA polymerase subunit RPC12/RpoP
VEQEDLNKNKQKDRNKQAIECIRCGTIMSEITVCHLRCLKCGSELTCSDKGNFW